MAKIDYRKDDKALYLPGREPVVVDVPPMSFLMIDGHGDPDGDAYHTAVATLYALTYTIKMKGKALPGYVDYTVYPLEGLWWTDGAFDLRARNDWLWTSMIRQPGFVDADVVSWAIEQAQRTKPDLPFDRVRLEAFAEGLCVQAMHVGPYADEPATVDRMGAYIRENGLRDAVGSARKHHEIYLSDPNRAKPESMKTVLRHPVEREEKIG